MQVITPEKARLMQYYHPYQKTADTAIHQYRTSGSPDKARI